MPEIRVQGEHVRLFTRYHCMYIETSQILYICNEALHNALPMTSIIA